MTTRIAIVGAGATALYCLKHLHESPVPLSITVFESGASSGKGMPYDPALNADYMLCNAFSREIPPLTQTLLQWLKTLPPRELDAWELSNHELNARAFYPRLLIGEFLENEFHALCRNAAARGHAISLQRTTSVADVVPSRGMFDVVTNDGQVRTFDHVILATGHVWPPSPEIDRATLISPWPYTSVTAVPAGHIGILGSSLSAIDVVMALAFSHGDFAEDGGTITWRAHNDSSLLRITMVSKMGIMPEADFYYPFPYQPLKIFTPEALHAEMNLGSDGLLTRIFALLYKELQVSDPEYTAGLGAEAGTIEGFARAYFKSRREMGGLEAVKRDFKRARTTMRERKTIPYRYVMLRAHETFDLALRALNEGDWDIFKGSLLPVFSDCYAAVPHLSIARLIALHDAGILNLRETGENARFRDSEAGGIEVSLGEEILSFDAMIDARGQTAASLTALPFPQLVGCLDGRDQTLVAPFAIALSTPASGRVYCLSMPQLLERHPFSQGLVNCEENAAAVADDLVRQITGR